MASRVDAVLSGLNSNLVVLKSKESDKHTFKKHKPLQRVTMQMELKRCFDILSMHFVTSQTTAMKTIKSGLIQGE